MAPDRARSARHPVQRPRTPATPPPARAGACPRCGSETDLTRSGWCSPCELAYDTWVRRHATDIIWSALGGGLVIGAIGLGLPLLGVGMAAAFAAAFAGVGTMAGAYRLVQRHRRRQFLRGLALPRAYLPSAK